MFEFGLLQRLGLALLLGWSGFIEPCSIGPNLVVVKQMEGQSARQKVVRMLVFAGLSSSASWVWSRQWWGRPFSATTAQRGSFLACFTWCWGSYDAVTDAGACA